MISFAVKRSFFLSHCIHFHQKVLLNYSVHNVDNAAGFTGFFFCIYVFQQMTTQIKCKAYCTVFSLNDDVSYMAILKSA